MLYRPDNFNDFIGHKSITRFCLNHIFKNTLPNFLIIHGSSGVGKTTLARLLALALTCTGNIKPCYECEHCVSAKNSVLANNNGTSRILLFKVSADYKGESTKEMLQHFNTNFIPPTLNKVILLDEAHQMSPQAQDLLLIDTEFLPTNLYVIMITTEILGLRETVISRAIEIKLDTLSNNELLLLLKKEANRRNLIIEQEEYTFSAIISWAENKPRRALKVLEAMGENRTLSFSRINEFIDFVDPSMFIPLVTSLSSEGFILGIQSINDLKFDNLTCKYLIDFLIDCIKIKNGAKKFNIPNKILIQIKESIKNIDIKLIARFLSGVSKHKVLSRNLLISEYLRIHPSLFSSIEISASSLLDEETRIKTLSSNTDTVSALEFKPKSDLENIQRGAIIMQDLPPTLENLLKWQK